LSETAHRHRAEAPKSVSIAIITCSTSKYWRQKQGDQVTDESGDLIEELAKKHGYSIHSRTLIPDNEAMIRQLLSERLADKAIDAILITGGTGMSPRDVTIEVVEAYMEKELPGFGELFRKISYEKIGSAAMLTRATGGVARGKAIFCLPGSPNAVEMGMIHLILPELAHVIKVARER